MRVAGVAVDPGSGHEVGAAAVQHPCVTALNGHLHSWIAGTIDTTSSSYLNVHTLQEGFHGGKCPDIASLKERERE